MKKELAILLPFLLILTLFMVGAFSPGSITFNNPLNNQNISGNVTINITISNAVNVSNVTFAFVNTTPGAMVTIGTNNSPNLNASALAGITFLWDTTLDVTGEGSGFVLIANVTEANATFQNNTASNITNLGVFNSGLSVFLNNPSANEFFNETEFNFSVVSNTYPTIDTCSLTIDGVVRNQTTNVANGTSSSTILSNASLDDGVLLWAVVCTDGSGLTASSSNQTVYLDTTDPNTTAIVSNGFGVPLLKAPRQIGYGQAATVLCSSGDDLTGLNKSRNYVSIKYPGLGSFSNLSLSENDNGTLEAEIFAEDTRTLGTYEVFCFTLDKAGNEKNSSISFEVVSTLNFRSILGAFRSSRQPTGTIRVNDGEVHSGGILTNEGTSLLISKTSAASFTVGAQSIVVLVDSISEERATFAISPGNTNVRLSAGSSEEVDLTGNGEADLKITYHQYYLSVFADVTFVSLVEEDSEEEKISDDGDDYFEEEYDYEEKKVKQDSKGPLVVTIAVILAILIIGYAFIVKK